MVRGAPQIYIDTAWAHMRGLNKERNRYIDTTMGAYAGIEQKKTTETLMCSASSLAADPINW